MSDICPSRDMAQPHIFSDGPYCKLCQAPDPRWTKAKVGFYWSNGPWNVATISRTTGGRVIESGYTLNKHGRLIGEYLTWAEVEGLVRGGL